VLWHDGYGYDVAFHISAEEAPLYTAHYIAYHMAISLCHEEEVGVTPVDAHEEVGGVVLRQARPIDVYDLLQVLWPEVPQPKAQALLPKAVAAGGRN